MNLKNAIWYGFLRKVAEKSENSKLGNITSCKEEIYNLIELGKNFGDLEGKYGELIFVW